MNRLTSSSVTRGFWSRPASLVCKLAWNLHSNLRPCTTWLCLENWNEKTTQWFDFIYGKKSCIVPYHVPTKTMHFFLYLIFCFMIFFRLFFFKFPFFLRLAAKCHFFVEILFTVCQWFVFLSFVLKFLVSSSSSSSCCIFFSRRTWQLFLFFIFWRFGQSFRVRKPRIHDFSKKKWREIKWNQMVGFIFKSSSSDLAIIFRLQQQNFAQSLAIPHFCLVKILLFSVFAFRWNIAVGLRDFPLLVVCWNLLSHLVAVGNFSVIVELKSAKWSTFLLFAGVWEGHKRERQVEMWQISWNSESTAVFWLEHFIQKYGKGGWIRCLFV